eukprot:gene1150-2223_t
MTTPQPVISHVNQNSVVATKLSIPKTEVQNKNRTLRAIVFTMDSISQYEENSKSGGAAGELLVRYSLQEALQTLNIIVEVKRSDAEFEASVPSKYDFIILDPWTWAGPGWIPKKCIRGQDNKIFILDFFGSEKLRGSGLRISKDRILTAFGSPWNTFLGYVSGPSPAPKEKRLQGVIWGKDPKHFEGKESLLRAVAAKVTLLSTATHGVFDHPNIQWRGHQTPQGWSQILSESRFLLDLGHPLLGPSAIDAISTGCMYINPIYDKPHRDIYLSQHPFAATAISNVSAIMECVEKAMTIKLDPIVPKRFSEEAHLDRFAPTLPAGLWFVFIKVTARHDTTSTQRKLTSQTWFSLWSGLETSPVWINEQCWMSGWSCARNFDSN